MKHVLPSRIVSTVTIEDVNTTGSTTEGVISVTLTVTGDNPVTIAGATFYSGEQLSLLDQGPYASVTYDARGSTLRIMEVN